MQNLTFHDFIKILKKWSWFLVTFPTIATLFMGYISFYKLTPIYSNTSTILVNDNAKDKEKSSLTFNDLMVNEKLMGTYKDIIKSKLILNEVGKSFTPALTAEQLEPMIKISANSNSQIFRISVENPNYALATKIANQVSETFSIKVQSLMVIDNVRILDPAELKEHPKAIKPNRTSYVATSFILSLFLSINFILIVHFLDTRIRNEADLIGLTNFPILGVVPNFHKKNAKSIYQ